MQVLPNSRFAISRFRSRCSVLSQIARDVISREERVPVSNINDLIDGPVRVRLDGYSGSFELNPRSRVFHRIMKTGAYEPQLAQLVRDLVGPGSHAIDVGANVGFYSVLLANLVGPAGRILAIEPNRQALDLLRSNITSNDADQIVVVQDVAVGAQAAQEASLYLIEDQPEFSSLKPTLHPAGNGQVTSDSVRMLTIDSLAEQHGISPSFIKIDIEGGELEALKGAQRVLRSAKPSVLCEIAGAGLMGPSHWSDVVSHMAGIGYRVVSVEDRSSAPLESEMGSDVLFLPSS